MCGLRISKKAIITREDIANSSKEPHIIRLAMSEAIDYSNNNFYIEDLKNGYSEITAIDTTKIHKI